MFHEYTKEEFEKQVKIGVEYAVECEMDEEQTIAHLTGHLWGTVGMLFTQEKVHTYNEPARVEEDLEIEGQTPKLHNIVLEGDIFASWW